ncbi:MAG: glutathione S-transferase family protein [Pseudomonadota bacterium]|nr:glutathione S-transferase family protein [Pseudomonadota bacterium]
MKLYDLTAGSNPRRVRIYLAEKGIEIPKVEVDMMKGEHQSPEYLKINAFGKMPALELDDGTILTESVAICRYFEALNPEPPMFGRNALEQGKVEMWNRRAELDIAIPTAQCFQNTHDFWKGRLTQVPAWGEACKANVLKKFKIFDEHLAGRAFLATDDYTVADISLQCGILLGKAVGIRVGDDTPNLKAWWERVSARPSARA